MKTEIVKKAIAKRAILYFGEEMQQLQSIEEMAELTQALIKYRKNPGQETFARVLDELADVKVMVKQLEVMFAYDKKRLEYVDQRWDALLNRLEK